MRISDWSSDVCSSDLLALAFFELIIGFQVAIPSGGLVISLTVQRDNASDSTLPVQCFVLGGTFRAVPEASGQGAARRQWQALGKRSNTGMALPARSRWAAFWLAICGVALAHQGITLPSLARLASRSEEHTSELQSLM